MNCSQPFDLQTKWRLTVLSIVAAALVVVFYSQASSTARSGEPQKRRRPATGGQPATPATPQRRSSRDRSTFVHDEDHVKIYNKTEVSAPLIANCETCHTLKTPTQYEIREYPDHPTCLRCHETHRKDFFIGTRPPICTVCHVKNFSPRNGARVEFPRPNTEITGEFKGYFPHGKHQDILARRWQPFEPGSTFQLLRASFTQDDKPKEVENCATCHKSYDAKDEKQLFSKIKWPQTFKLDAKSGIPEGMKFDEKSGLPSGTFKQSPEGWDGHRTCFVCHGSVDKPWLSPQPVAENCAGCHLPVTKGVRESITLSAEAKIAAQRPVQRPSSTDPASAAGLPMRKIFLFQHDLSGHDVVCTTCHIRITEQTSLNPLPDVPITSCTPCHQGTGQTSLRAGGGVFIKTEMDAWLASNKDNLKCIGCHALEITGKTIPCSHYDVVGETRQQCR